MSTIEAHTPKIMASSSSSSSSSGGYIVEEKKIAEQKKQLERRFNELVAKAMRAREGVRPEADQPAAAVEMCPICVQPYGSRRRRMACPYQCGGEACIQCHHRYLMDSPHNPHCMACRREWDPKVCLTHFTASMNSDLRKRHHLVLLVREKALLPQVQVVLERQRSAEEIANKINELQWQIRNLTRDRERILGGDPSGPDDQKPEPSVTKCPISECRGFLARGRCGVCNTRVCMKCMVEMKSMHECLPADMASIELIRKTSKACPGCGLRTIKTEGCNQMWCIECHKAWDWSTGRLYDGIVHNPHFFEWQRRTQGHVQRNPADVQCGGLPNYIGESVPHGEYFNAVLRTILHVRDVYLANGPVQETNSQDLGLKYLRNEITEERWGAVLQRRHKEYLVRTELFNVHQMFYLAGSDIMLRFLAKDLVCTEARTQFEALRRYYNSQLLLVVALHKVKFSRFYVIWSSEWMPTSWKNMEVVAECLDEEYDSRFRNVDNKPKPKKKTPRPTKKRRVPEAAGVAAEGV